MDIEIRRAKPEDYWDLAELSKKVGNEKDGHTGYLAHSNYEIIKSCCESSDRFFLVARANEKLVGFCTLVFGNPLINQEHMGEIGIAIDPEQRGKGISALLVKEMINLFRNTNIKVLKAIVIENNIRAINFFKKMGFEKKGHLFKEFLDRDQGLYRDNHIYYFEL